MRLLLVPLTLAALAACGATTSSLEMLPSGMVVDHQLEGAVRLETEGSGGFRERVGGEDLKIALRQGILDSSLFQSVADAGPADWVLTVSVAKISNPEPDLFPEVEATLVWQLTNATGDRVLWEQTIATKAEASPQDHLDYVAREGIAMGRAVAKNLSKGIERLSKLELTR